MKSMPSWGSRFRTAIALSWSGGSPQIPSPVMRIAPYPRRVTSRSPPILKVPDAVAVVVMGPRVPRRRASYPARAMTAGSIPPASATGAAVFDVERFEWPSPEQLELHGRWYGVRGLRFVRPTLMLRADGVSRRLLATLEHKPWAALDGEPWVAAFPWQGEPLEFEEVELAVTSAVVLILEPPALPGGARRKKASRPDDKSRALLQEREQARQERDAALTARETALRERDEALDTRNEALRESGAAAQAQLERLREELESART